MKRLLGFSAAFLVTIAPQAYSIAQNQPACASVATPAGVSWTDFSDSNTPAGTLDLQQDADGAVSGTLTPGSGVTCQDSFSIRGSSAQGNGKFTLTGTNDADPIGVGCTSSFTGTVTVSGAGCATGSFVWSNASGYSGTDPWSDAPGVEPTGETTPLPLWQDSEVPTTYFFTQNLVPTSYDFVGRAVTETFPDGLTNGCDKNPGSPVIQPSGPHTTYPELNSVSDGGTPINGVTSSYADQIGLNVATVDLIRGVGDAPCVVSTVQYLWIDISTGSGYDNYQQNNIYITVGTITMTDQRGPSAPITWKYLSPGQKSLTTIIVNGWLQRRKR